MREPENRRELQADAHREFIERWSPRAFSREPVPEASLAALFEAARWAPSCFNEQPWLFLYATTQKDRDLFLSCLVESNRRWAANAPVVAFVLAKKRFAKTGEPNRWAPFDAGAAWMSLALQARKLGLHTHAMGGFDVDRTYDALGIPREDYDVMAALVVGRYGDPEALPPAVRRSEAPNGRKPLGEVAQEGPFRG